jgi:hypothetical protein
MTLQLTLIFAGIALVLATNYALWRNVLRQIREIYSRIEKDGLETTRRIFAELNETEPSEPWFVVRCGVCDHEVTFDNPIEPGQVAVVRCGQCNTAWAAVLDPVYVVKADGLELKEEQLIGGY